MVSFLSLPLYMLACLRETTFPRISIDVSSSIVQSLSSLLDSSFLSPLVCEPPNPVIENPKIKFPQYGRNETKRNEKGKEKHEAQIAKQARPRPRTRPCGPLFDPSTLRP